MNEDCDGETRHKYERPRISSVEIIGNAGARGFQNAKERSARSSLASLVYGNKRRFTLNHSTKRRSRRLPDGDSTKGQARPQQPLEQTNRERLAAYFEMAVDSEEHLDEVHSWIVNAPQMDKGSKLLSRQMSTLGSMWSIRNISKGQALWEVTTSDQLIGEYSRM
jgi:hypothetical protein